MAPYGENDRGYSETSLPRARNDASPSSSGPSGFTTVTILKSEYEALLRRSLEYERLKQALIRGGIPYASLETLIQGPDHTQEIGLTGITEADNTSGDANPENGRRHGSENNNREFSKPVLHGHPQHHSNESTPQSKIDVSSRPDSYDNDDASFPSDEKLDSPVSRDGYAGSARQITPSSDNRTVVIKGIPERATHRDVVAIIRGGALVDVFLRARERLASISFADGRAAHEFLMYAKRERLYVLDKLVDVSWSERQFTLSTYINSQLSNGASRNLIIRGALPTLTESRIREDMEHIHNLIIISVTFSQGNAHISTNSVQKASFARNCMRSRLPYKLMRIEYYDDECAEPLPKVRHIPRKDVPRPATKLNPMANRFQMLNLDEEDDDSDASDELTSHASLGGVSWANTAIAV